MRTKTVTTTRESPSCICSVGYGYCAVHGYFTSTGAPKRVTVTETAR